MNYLDSQQIKLGNKLNVKDIIEFDGTYIVEINKKQITLSEKISQNLLIEPYD